MYYTVCEVLLSGCDDHDHVNFNQHNKSGPFEDRPQGFGWIVCLLSISPIDPMLRRLTYETASIPYNYIKWNDYLQLKLSS